MRVLGTHTRTAYAYCVRVLRTRTRTRTRTGKRAEEEGGEEQKKNKWHVCWAHTRKEKKETKWTTS